MYSGNGRHLNSATGLRLIALFAYYCCRSRRQLEKDLDNVRRAEKVRLTDYNHVYLAVVMPCVISLYPIFPAANRRK